MKSSLLVITLLLISATLLAQSSEKKGKTLRHVVLFKFKESSSSKDVESVITEFTSLKTKIKQIKGLEWGLNNSPEKLNEGLTHAFILTFSSEKDRDDYLVHPDHKKFGELVGSHIDKVVVVDFWVN